MRIRSITLLCIFLFSCYGRYSEYYRDVSRDEIVLYQIMIDRFFDGDKTNNYKVDLSNPYGFHGGDIKGIIEKMDYLVDLGINGVILSPVIDNVDDFVEYEGYKHYAYHGYWPEDFGRIEEHFGDLNTLIRLSDALHKNKIMYIQDIVLNHAGYRSFWEDNPLWVRSVKMGGCVQSDEKRMCLFGLPDFKTERSDVRRFLIGKYKELLIRVGFDGVRIDAMKHIEPLFVKEIKEDFRNIKKDILFIGEFWGSSADQKGLSIISEYNVDLLFDFGFRDYLSGFLRGQMRPEAFVSYLNRRYEFAKENFITFLNNHDLDGLLTHFETCSGDEKVRLLRLMALMQFMCGGVPLIYYGEENGLLVGKGVENRRDMQFVEEIEGQRRFYKELIRLRKNGIFSGVFNAELRDGLLFIELNNSSGKVILIINRDKTTKITHLNDQEITLRPVDYVLLNLKDGKPIELIAH